MTLIGWARRSLVLGTRLLQQFDDHLDAAWEPFLVDDGDSAPLRRRSGSPTA